MHPGDRSRALERSPARQFDHAVPGRPPDLRLHVLQQLLDEAGVPAPLVTVSAAAVVGGCRVTGLRVPAASAAGAHGRLRPRPERLVAWVGAPPGLWIELVVAVSAGAGLAIGTAVWLSSDLAQHQSFMQRHGGPGATACRGTAASSQLAQLQRRNSVSHSKYENTELTF